MVTVTSSLGFTGTAAFQLPYQVNSQRWRSFV